MATEFRLTRSAKICGAALVFLCAAGAGVATAASAGGDSPDYPRNARGNSFGKMPAEGPGGGMPDLVAVVGVNGKSGYVRADDLGINDEPPSSPEEALRQQAERQDGEVPVFAEDGTTVIDSFVIEAPADQPQAPDSE